jgi:hypothetical protein
MTDLKPLTQILAMYGLYYKVIVIGDNTTFIGFFVHPLTIVDDIGLD